MEPSDADAVSAMKMPHRWVTAGRNDLDGRLIILIESQTNVAFAHLAHHIKGWKSDGPESEVGRGQFGFRRAVTHRGESLGLACKREKCKDPQ